MAGVGKTRLVEQALRSATEQGIAALSARAVELEQAFPFGVVRQLLEGPLMRASPAQRKRLLAGAAQLAGPALGVGAELEQDVEPTFGALHGLYWLVCNMAELEPVLLAVDDGQWADTASIRFIGYVARRLEDLPVMIVLAARTGEPGLELRLMAELAAEPGATSLSPQPLSVEGTARMMEQELGAPPKRELVEGCHHATAGNPFFVRELAVGISAEGHDGAVASLDVVELAPRSVSLSILLRLGRLGDGVVSLARAVVILGDEVELSEAAELAELELEEASDAADKLIRAHLFAPDRRLSFIHSLVRSAIEADMTAPEQEMWHARAARILIARGAREDRIAAQLLIAHGSGDPTSATRLRDAGRNAIAKGSPGTAVEYLRRALAEPPPRETLGDVLAELGTAEMLADNSPDAIPHLIRGRELAADVGSRTDRTIKLWLAMLATGAVTDGIALLESTIDEVAESDREAWLMLEGELFTAGLFAPSEVRRIWARLSQFADLPGETPAERRLLASVAAMSMYTASHPAKTVAKIARRAVRDGELVRENLLESTKWLWGVGCLIVTDQIEDSERWLELAHAAAQRAGSIDGFMFAYDLRSYFRLRQGRLRESETDAQLVLELVDKTGDTPMRDLLELAMVRWLCASFVERGEATAADTLLRERGLEGDLDGGQQHVKLYRERGMVRLLQGRNEDALRDALALRDAEEQLGISDLVEGPWRPVAARACAQLGRVEEAISFADAQLKIARRWALPRDVGIALVIRGLVEPDGSKRITRLTAAVDTLALAPAPLELAKARAELGSALLRAGKRTDGMETLRPALDGATRCGATALAQRVHSELKVAGARPRRLMFSGVGGLTASERRVAELAAQGLTNRQIAQSLFVTLKTIESHLSNVFRKLEISSRGALAERLEASDDREPAGAVAGS
jgi:DNA-binding CsgD family transcriptional regulator